MKRILNILMEAKRPVKVIDKTPQYQALYDYAKKVAMDIQNSSWIFKGAWKQDWTKSFSAAVSKAQDQHMIDQQKEKEYSDHHGDTFTPYPFDIKAAAQDVIGKWWTNMEHHVEILKDVDYKEAQYFGDKPWVAAPVFGDDKLDVEDSPAIRVFTAEKEVGKWAQAPGSFSTVEGMMKVLEAIDNLARIYFNTTTGEDEFGTCDVVVTNGIPFIMYYAKLMGAK